MLVPKRICRTHSVSCLAWGGHKRQSQENQKVNSQESRTGFNILLEAHNFQTLQSTNSNLQSLKRQRSIFLLCLSFVIKFSNPLCFKMIMYFSAMFCINYLFCFKLLSLVFMTLIYLAFSFLLLTVLSLSNPTMLTEVQHLVLGSQLPNLDISVF